MADNNELLALALKAAQAATLLVRERREGVVEVAATKSTATDVVTQADKDSEELIRSIVLSARPDDGFLGEEGDDIVGSSGVRWIVDPIDGTVNFLYGIGRYAVSIAAESDGEVVAGVVVDVPRGVTFSAVRRDRVVVSMRDGEPIAAREPVELGHQLVLTGFSYDSAVRARQGKAVATLLPQVRDIRRIGAAALDLCSVAEGTADAYVEEGLNPWDYAAGGLIAEGAGARWRLFDHPTGRPVMVCTPADSFDEFVALVNTAGFLRE